MDIQQTIEQKSCRDKGELTTADYAVTIFLF